ncbi:hypothetical protein VZQ01_14760 [Myxococcus faecalis]|uniref:hypothetical protein n=1 Tax=Myxococcus faecalis TaxID=3115646 RepID=UPI003CE9F25B
MKLKIAELRHVTNRLFDHLEQRGHLEVEFPEDFFGRLDGATADGGRGRNRL